MLTPSSARRPTVPLSMLCPPVVLPVPPPGTWPSGRMRPTWWGGQPVRQGRCAGGRAGGPVHDVHAGYQPQAGRNGAAQDGQRCSIAQEKGGAGRICGAQVAGYSLYPGGDGFYLQPRRVTETGQPQLPEENGPGDSRGNQGLVSGASPLGHTDRLAETAGRPAVHHRQG